MSGQYAKDTRVTVARSREELHRILTRYGATETLIHEMSGGIRVGFVLDGLRIAFPFALPVRDDYDAAAGYEREMRRRWRVLLLVLKSRLESVAEGAERVSDAFLPYLMLPDGSLVRDEAVPRIQEAYRTGRMPETLLPSLPRISAKVIELPSRVGG